MKRKYFTCDCPSFEHTLRLSYFEDLDPPTMYIETCVYKPKNFFKRVWVALKFIFSRDVTKYGHTSEFLACKETAKNLSVFMSEFVIKVNQQELLKIIVSLISRSVFKVDTEQDVYNFAVTYEGFHDLLERWYNERDEEEKKKLAEDIKKSFNDIDLCTSVVTGHMNEGNKCHQK